MKTSLISCAFATFITISIQCSAHSEEVGVAGATNPDAIGAHASRPSHILKLGESILFKEKISTNTNGSLQVSFTDGSGMAIGPNASLVIDEYIYDPNKGAAAMSASLVKGALRFVGGAISHDKGIKITTPVATIGVRGGIATISFTPTKNGTSGTLDVMHHFGITTITTPNGTFTITQKDFKFSIGSDGQLNQGNLMNLAAFNALLKTLTSQNKQTGGAINLPSDALMSRNGIESPRAGQQPFDFTLPQSGEAASGSQLDFCTTKYCPDYLKYLMR